MGAVDIMATVRTTKQFHTKQLFDLLGGLYADVSTNGVPLDSTNEKEITVTVKGDGETPITQAELDALVASYTYDPNYGRTQDEIDIDDFLAKANPQTADLVKAAKAMGRKLRGRK